nr:hypothetical protein [Tanacetum cinerariifolium]GFB60476.1 hypothetical protein [Tanacetum cinerariifolium]
MMDYMNLDEKSIVMFWVVSYTMAQSACEMVMTWLTYDGYTELPKTNSHVNGKVTVRREVNHVLISLLSGFPINQCLKLAVQLEDKMFSRMHLHHRNPKTFNKPGATLLETILMLRFMSNASLAIEIESGNVENNKLVKEINELKTTLLAAMSP